MEIEEAIAALVAEVQPISDYENVLLIEATGRVLAKDIRAPYDVPHFPKSAMDGYAVCAEGVKDATPDRPVTLRVMGEMLAGDTPLFSGRSKEACKVTAVRIMTGAAVPEGYDAVVRQEDTDYGETEVQIYKSVAPYTNYCKVGEDVQKGSVVLTAGRRIGRVEAGVLASLGISVVPVVRRIRVTIISTGSELCDPIEMRSEPSDDGFGGYDSKHCGTTEAESLDSQSAESGSSKIGSRESGSVSRPPEAGKIYNSIAYTLTASLTEAGFLAEHGICADDAETISAALERALRTSDVVITTGGVSVGKKDLLPEVLDSIGAKWIFSGINVQPGTPTIGSVKDGKAILSLSGNPYAALVNYDLYFWPVAAKLMGCDGYLPKTEEAVLASEYPKVNRLRRLLRARVEGGRVTLPAKSHASSVLSNLLDCNCYIDLPKETEVHPGDTVKVIRMK